MLFSLWHHRKGLEELMIFYVCSMESKLDGLTLWSSSLVPALTHCRSLVSPTS